MNRTLVRRILRYASSHKKPIDTSAIKAEKEKWRAQLARLKAWKAVRATATGHYGEDIERQIELLKGSVRKRCSVATALSSTRPLFCIYSHRRGAA